MSSSAFAFALLCLAPSGTGPFDGKLEVVTTLSVLKSLAEEVGGEHVHVQALSDPRQDPHYVEPRPTLMQKARNADLFVEVGLQLELWAEKVASGSGNTRIQSGQPGRVIASAGIQTLELPAVLSREWGDVHPYGNPHVWLDPLNAKTMAENIARALEALDPAHAPDYRQNLERFQARIDEALFGAELVKNVGGRQLSRLARQGRLTEYLERQDLAGSLGGWLRKAEPLRGRPVVTYHKTSVYLADRFGFEVPVEIEEKPGIPPSARHRDHVLELMRERQVKTILQEIFYERSAADYLAEKTGAHVVVVPIDVGSEVGVKDYFELIDHVLGELVRSETSGS
jgi:zinc/manganese transport system substrate-binding protein